MMPEHLIELINVSRTYRHADIDLSPLKDLSLHVDRGDFLALVGPSGSGKSTLLNILAGIDSPTSGHVMFEGGDIARLGEDQVARWRSRHVGFVFQAYNHIPVLTAFENVELPLLLTSLSARDRADHARAALEIVGLGDRLNHYPRQLSGGQEQRAAIARAIVTDPSVVLADEPTGDLDAESAEEVLTLFHKLNSSAHKTIVMVTHDLRAIEYATAWKKLDKGHLTEFTPAKGATV